MANSDGNVIILGKLDDSALRNSIDELVKKVEESTNKMAKSFDDGISDMIKSFGKLGAVSTNVEKQSGARTEAAKKEKDAIKETTATYDQMAQAQQKVTKNTSLETNLKALREQATDLQITLKSVENTSFYKQYAEFQRWEKQIISTKERIEELKNQIRGGADKFVRLANEQEIARLEQQLRNLTEQQTLGVKRIEQEDKQWAEMLRQEYNTIYNKIQEMLGVKRQDVQFSQQQATAAQKHTEEIKKQAQAIRESKEFQERGLVSIPSKYQSTNYTVLKSNELSIEDQLLQIMKQEEQLTKSHYATEEKTTQQKEQQVNLTRTQQEIYNRGVAAQRDWLGGKVDPNSYDRLKQAMRDLNNAYEIMRQNGSGQTAEAQRFKQSAIEVSNALNRLAQTGLNAKKEYKTLRDVVADLLNIESREVVMANDATCSYKRLQKMLSQLRDAYSRMNAEQRNSDWGMTLKATISETELAVRNLKKEMSRPMSLRQIMGLDEKTLDNISYKIQQLTAYRANLNLDTQYGEIRKVNAELQRLQKQQQEAMATNNRYARSNDALSRSFAYIRNRLAFYLSVGATTGFVKQIIEIRGQYEALERSISVLTDSAQRGHEIFNQLNQMAMNSPFTTIELGEAARQLVAYGVAAEDVVDTTRRLADISAAVGQPVDRLTYALGQIQTYGYLTSIQAKTFMRAGVPLVKELADRYSELEGRIVSTGEVYDRMKHKAVSYADVVSVINKETDEGGRFFDYQSKMASTLKIQLANLTLAWNTMLNDIGKSNQSLIAAPIKGLKTLFAHWQSIDRIIKALLGTFALFKLAQAAVLLRAGKLSTVLGWQTLIGKKLTFAFKSLGLAMKQAFTSPATWLTLLTFMLVDLFAQIGANKDAIIEMNREMKNMASESSKALDEFLDKNSELENSLYKRNAKGDIIGYNNLEASEAGKVWAEIREEISNSSNASDYFIAKLTQIADINERVREGFKYARLIREAKGTLTELGDEAVKVEKDLGWWGMFGEGLKSDTEDYIKQLGVIKERYGGIYELEQMIMEARAKNTSPGSAANDYIDYNRNLKEFQNEIKTTRDSIVEILDSTTIDFTSKMFNPEDFESQIQKALEIVDSASKSIIESEKMGSQEAFEFRRELDKQIRDLYQARLNAEIKLSDSSEREKYAKAVEIFNNTYYENRVSFQRFTEWLKRTHKVALDDMYNKWTENGTKGLNFMDEKVKKQFMDWLQSFKTNNQSAYNDLVSWVNLANLLKINIGVLFDTEGEAPKSALEGLKEADQAANQAWQDVERLTLRLSQLKKGSDEYLKVQKELTDARNRYNKAVQAGGKSSKKESEDKKAERDRINAAKRAENERKREAAKEEARRKREEAARRREQKQQEDELAKALKDEVSLVDKLRSSYDKLRKSGVAPDMIASVLYTNYEDTFKDINKSLKKYGLEEISVFDLIDPITKEFKNDQNVFEFFTQQLEKVKNSGRSTREAIKALEEELAKMREELQIKGMEGIFKTLKENLDFASNEYELSLDVEENPELADLMSSMMNVDITDMLKDAPKSLREYTDKVNDIIDGAIRAYWVNMNPEKGLDEYFTEFNARNFNILDKDTFDKIRQELTPDSQLFKEIEKLREDLLKKNRKFFDDMEKTYEQYLQKHGDYADKIRKIEEKKYSDLKTLDDVYNTDALKSTYDYQRRREAIIQSAKESKQKTDFEEFKESETYLELFDNLDYASETTLTMMINKIREMRQELTDLDPSELKKLAEYEQQLRDQMIKRNPFKNFKKEFKEYISLQKQRKQIEKNAVKAEDEVKTQQKIVSVLSDQLEQMKTNGEYGTDAYKKKEEELKSENKKLGVLKKQNKAAQQQVTTLNQSETAMRQRASSMADFLGYALDAVNALNQIAQESNNIDLQNATEATSDILGNLQAAAQGFAQGGVWGAVAAGVMDLAPKLVKWFNKESGIDKAIQRSEREVKKLQNTLKNLEDTAEDAYGAVTIGAQNAIRANKELQLVELERQLRLEQSRKKKKRDQDKIIDLKGQIIDLRNEINNSSEDVVNDLLGISGAGSWAEELVSSMIEAFRNGEDAMEKFSEKWDEMIDNMIMKYIVSTVMQRWWDNVLKGVEDIEESYTKDIAKEKADAQREYDEIRDRSDREIKDQMIKDGYWNALLEKYKNTKVMATNARYDLIPKEDVEAFRNGLLNSALTKVEEVDGRLDQASIDATKAITDYMLGRKGEGEAIAQQLKDTIGQYYQFGESANKDLSQLQQGIQGITEDTASALESYMNGVSQQVYLQSDLMTQIRDVVVGYDPVLSMGLQSQMLLELQNSYQIQVAIQNILVGWSNPSGNAVQVSLI